MQISSRLIRAVSFTIALAATIPASYADVPPVDSVGVPAVVTCGPGPEGVPIRAVHMDKVIFRITGPLIAAIPADQGQLNLVPTDSRLDIKVLDNPRTVADLKGKVLTFLRAVDNAVNRASIVIDDVDYSVICPHPNAGAGAP